MNIHPSATLAVSARAAQMRREGRDVIGFGAGEPDFDTPPHIKQAATRALSDGYTGYAKPSHGIPIAREAVCEKFRRDNALTYAPEQVIVTVGGKEALFLAFAALIDPGDEVILPVPYWVSFAEQIRFFGGVVVPVVGTSSNALRITSDQLGAALTPKTKIVVFNSPSNPGGFSYSPDEVRMLAEVVADRDVVVFSDEMYDRLLYGAARTHLSFANASPAAYDKTITFNAVSKTHAMTGWRAGFAAGPQEIIGAMARIQSHSTSGTATFIQHAMVEALTGDQSHVESMRLEFERRGRHMHQRLASMPGVKCFAPTGAFYCFPDVSATYPRLGVADSSQFCTRVLEEAHVALVPGAAFGAERHVRLSFATDLETIDRGLDRLAKLLGG